MQIYESRRSKLEKEFGELNFLKTTEGTSRVPLRVKPPQNNEGKMFVCFVLKTVKDSFINNVKSRYKIKNPLTAKDFYKRNLETSKCI